MTSFIIAQMFVMITGLRFSISKHQDKKHIIYLLNIFTVPQSLPDARDLWDMGIMCNAKLFIPPCFSLVIMHFSIINLCLFSVIYVDITHL